MKVNGPFLAQFRGIALSAASLLALAVGCSDEIDELPDTETPVPSQMTPTAQPPAPPPRPPAIPVPPPAPSPGDEVNPATPTQPPSGAGGAGSPPMEMPMPEMPATPPPPPGPGVLLDVDLTLGNAGNGRVVGGAWEDGWRVTEPMNQRIVWDLGRPVANGLAEVSFTMKGSTLANGGIGKLNWAGLHEHETLSQNLWSGDIFYARTGKAYYKFSKIKAYGRQFDKSEWEQSIGSLGDWATDDKTIQTVKFEWKDGGVTFHDTKGRTFRCPSSLCNPKLPVDRLRYMFVGSDQWIHLTVPGMRFKHVKVTDRGGEPLGPPGMPAMGPAGG